MLRLLRQAGSSSTGEGSNAANSTTSKPVTSNSKSPVTLRVYIPAFGGVFMTSHQPAATEFTDPASTSQRAEFVNREVSGEIEIQVRRGAGALRCRAIKVTLRSMCRLYMGEKRGWEEDVLFERTVERKGALVLEEGIQRLSFTVFAPYSLPTWDTVPGGIVRNYLTATVDGLGAAEQLPLVRATCGHDLGNYADGIPAPFPDQVQTQMTVSWAEPVGASTSRSSLITTDSSGSSAASALSAAPLPWLKGSVSESRCITYFYNPHPTNGINILDERQIGDVEGLGALNVRFLSQVWSISALLLSCISFPAPSAKVVIYHAQVSLGQIAAVSSPRDPEGTPPQISKQEFLIWQVGQKPPPKRPAPKDYPAFWRGTEAHGMDTGAVNLSGTGRLPNDETARPSTLDGINTPVRIKHELIADVLYSVYGERLDGSPVPGGGHGQLRRLRVDKPVIVPSCAFIPEVLELPSYEWHNFENEPCRTCKTWPQDQACRSCPLGAVPHPRHDLDPAVYDSGTCPECEGRFIPGHDIKWANCACGLSLNDLKDRLKLEEEWQRSLRESAAEAAGGSSSSRRLKFGREGEAA